MSLITRMLRQRCTYFAPDGVDSFGKQVYLRAEEIRCRWEDVREQFMNKDGDTVVSNSKVYVGEILPLGGVLCKSLLVDLVDEYKPFLNENAYEIRKVGEMPNLKCTEKLREIML